MREDLFKNPKGRREPAAGAGSAGGRGARCALQPRSPDRASSGVCAEAAGRGRLPRGWGKRLQSCARDTAAALGRGSGESRPRLGPRPPARAAPLSENGDMTARGRVPTPPSRCPRSAPAGSAPRSGPPGKPREAEGRQPASAVAPHFVRVGLGPRTAAPGCGARSCPPARLVRELRRPFLSSRQPGGDPGAAQTRAPLWLGPGDACQGHR